MQENILGEYHPHKTTKNEPIDEIDELFQYEALIEQLKIEKSDYINKCKKYSHLLNEIYNVYKDHWGLSASKPFEKMNISELEEVFKLKK